MRTVARAAVDMTWDRKDLPFYRRVASEQDGTNGKTLRAAATQSGAFVSTEGQITMLTPLKRQMYGRAKLDLLRRRVLLAA